MGKTADLRKQQDAARKRARGRALMYFTNTFVGQWPRKTGLRKIKMTDEDQNNPLVIEELQRWVAIMGSAYGVYDLFWKDGAVYADVAK